MPEKEFRSLSAGNDGYVRVWVVPPSEDDSSSYYEYYDDDSTVANDPDIDVDGLQAMMKELDMDVDDDMPDLDALLKELDDLLKELDEIEV